MSPRLILWDLDQTLCRHNDRFHQEAPRAVARAALEAGVPLTLSAAEAFARRHYPGQKTAVRAFARTYGLDPDTLFQLYYRHLQPDFLETDPPFCKAVAQSLPHVTHGVLTQAPRLWIDKALAKLSLSGYFDPRWLVGHEKLGGHPKSSTDAHALLSAALQEARLTRADVALVDDHDFILRQYEDIIGHGVLLDPQKLDPQKTAAGIPCAATPLEALRLLQQDPFS